MYCRNTNNQLIQTITTDTACTGTTVIANNVSTFSATLPTSLGAVDKSIAEINITLSDANNNSINYISDIRLGGGAL
jgi:hypothetical protein